MRIRKRQALFSSSSESLTPLHLSDPNLIIRSPVVVQLGDDTHAHTVPKHVSPASSLDRYQPSDQTLPLIGKVNNGCDYPSGIEESGTHKQHNKLDPLDEKVREEEKESGESRENKSNHISKGDILVVSQVLPSSSTTFAQDGRWCEGEKAIPLKKRRGRFENDKILESNNDSKKVMKGKMMKTKMNKKCSTVKDEEDEEESGSKNKKRMRKRGSAVVMEGSRCSRVNGRGWRCCQQTLVGYSLCEHHLGKGRLRSMTSVRNRSIGIGFSNTTTTTAPSLPKNNINASSSNSDVVEKKMMNCAGNDDDKTENFDEKKQKKRVKLGMVKARSISSLLGQPDNKVAPVGDENNK